jgi:hypothetical protein
MATRDDGRRKPASKMDPSDGTSTTASSAHPGAGMEAELQAYIGRQLRAVYDEIVNEPVPDKFVQLLSNLERKKASDA